MSSFLGAVAEAVWVLLPIKPVLVIVITAGAKQPVSQHLLVALSEVKMSSEPLKKHDRAAGSGDKRSKKKPKRKEAFSVYIYKVLKQVSKWWGFFC